MVTAPAVARVRPTLTRIVVDLPAPLDEGSRHPAFTGDEADVVDRGEVSVLLGDSSTVIMGGSAAARRCAGTGHGGAPQSVVVWRNASRAGGRCEGTAGADVSAMVLGHEAREVVPVVSTDGVDPHQTGWVTATAAECSWIAADSCSPMLRLATWGARNTAFGRRLVRRRRASDCGSVGAWAGSTRLTGGDRAHRLTGSA